MKKLILHIFLLMSQVLLGQETQFFIRPGFFVCGGTFKQDIHGKVIMADSKGATVEISNPEFTYTGLTTGASALVGVNYKKLFIMAGVKNFVLSPDAIETNFTIDNLGLPDPINYGLGTLRFEYDFAESEDFYISPMAAYNYIFHFEGSKDFFEKGSRGFSYSVGITGGIELKRFKILLTPFFSKIPMYSNLYDNLYKETGAELSVHVNLF